MGRPQYSTSENALLVFADLVDSSKYSAVVGIEKYARQLLYFQGMFKELGRVYFPEPKPTERTEKYSEVVARGDEGIVFCVDHERAPEHLVFRAIEFIFELKSRLKFGLENSDLRDAPPRVLGLGAGVHFGEVALIADLEENPHRSVIRSLEGFAINYAKRIENCSRAGRHSQVFLSRAAARLVEGEPVVLSEMLLPMKGIHEQEEVYEVCGGFFRTVPIETQSKEGEFLVDRAMYLAEHPEELDERWLKSIVVSILDSRFRASPEGDLKDLYQERLLKLARHSPTEDDPILLFVRARWLQQQQEYTRQLHYLKEIVRMHPDFIPARKMMIRACWRLAQKRAERAEMIYARDMAREFLEQFATYLSEEEQTEFRKFISHRSVKRRRDPRPHK